MSAEKLLSRLEKVKETRPGRWLACCPAHEDKSPSLSIRELEDGRVLVHDFAGCEVGAVLDALGLKMTDLFPEEIQRREFKPVRLDRLSAREALALLDRESHVVALIASDFLNRQTLDSQTWQRLAKAVSRIGKIARGST